MTKCHDKMSLYFFHVNIILTNFVLICVCIQSVTTMPQTQTIEQMQEDLFSMKRRLESTPKEIGGAYNRKYYSLKAQIKNKQDVLDKAKMQAWLGQ